MPKILPPLDFTDEIKDYESFNEKKEIIPTKCNHKKITLVDSTHIRCECGTGYSGSNITELYNLLKNQ